MLHKYKDVQFIEREKCCICNCTSLNFEQNIYDFDSNLGYFKLLKCPRCGMYYTSPYPTESTLSNLYNQRDTKNFDSKNSSFFEFLKNILAKIQISGFSEFVPNTKLKILDFGCGNARWALAFQQVFTEAEVYACDFMPEAPESLKGKKRKAPIYFSTNEFYNNGEKYDIIFLRHVVEHVENPKLFIQNMLERLTNTGFIYIEVPNIKNGLRPLFNRWLPSYYPPYHLVHFTDKNIAALLEELDIEYEIFHTEMPIMSNIIANMCASKLNNWHRILGMFLHPIQILLCIKSHTVITVKIKNKISKQGCEEDKGENG